MSDSMKLVHQLKYNGGDCISEHLRVLFPDLHSQFCLDGVKLLVHYAYDYNQKIRDAYNDIVDCDCDGDLGTDE